MRGKFKTQDEIKYSTFPLSDRIGGVRVVKIVLPQDCYLLLTSRQSRWFIL